MNRDKKGYFLKGHKLGGRPPSKYTEEELSKLADHLYEWVQAHRMQNKFVLLSEWCLDTGFHPTSFGRYIDKHEGFKAAYEWAKTYQEVMICKNALQNKFNARFSQFFLAVNHKWIQEKDSDSKEINQKSNLEKMSEYLHKEKDDEEEDEEE